MYGRPAHQMAVFEATSSPCDLHVVHRPRRPLRRVGPDSMCIQRPGRLRHRRRCLYSNLCERAIGEDQVCWCVIGDLAHSVGEFRTITIP